MARVENADTTEFPSANDFPKGSAAVQERLAGPEGQLVDRVGRKVVAHVGDAVPSVASLAVDVLRSVGFATTNRAIVDGMSEGVTRLKGKPVGKPMIEGNQRGVIGALPDIVLEIDGAVWVCRLSRIGGVGAGEVLV